MMDEGKELAAILLSSAKTARIQQRHRETKQTVTEEREVYPRMEMKTGIDIAIRRQP